MKHEFSELHTHPTLRLAVHFSDWDRGAVNGNSLGLFIVVYSENKKPRPTEILLRNNGAVVGKFSRFNDHIDTLAILCPTYSKTAVYSDLCLNRLVLGSEGELEVYIADETGQRFLLGIIRFSENISDEYIRKIDLSLRPILISSLGRSGSTVLANCLEQHPAISKIGGYPFEYRFFSYCLHAIYVLTSPANHNISMGSDAFEIASRFNLGFNPFNHREYDKLLEQDYVRQFYEGRFTVEVVNFFMEQASNFLKIFSDQKKEAAFFVEKIAGVHLTELAGNIINGCTEIILFRKFWDMVSSKVAFDAKRGITSFHGNADTWLLSMAFDHACLSRRAELPGKILVHYEDLIQDTKNTLQRLTRELGFKSKVEDIELMMEPFRDNSYRELHSTDPRTKSEVKGLFSTTAIEAVNRLLLTRGDSKEKGDKKWDVCDLEMLRKNRNTPAFINWGRANTPVTLQETIGYLFEQEQKQLLRKYDEAINQISAQSARASRAETYNRALLNELSAQSERASRAETYNQSLLNELAKFKKTLEK